MYIQYYQEESPTKNNDYKDAPSRDLLNLALYMYGKAVMTSKMETTAITVKISSKAHVVVKALLL